MHTHAATIELLLPSCGYWSTDLPSREVIQKVAVNLELGAPQLVATENGRKSSGIGGSPTPRRTSPCHHLASLYPCRPPPPTQGALSSPCIKWTTRSQASIGIGHEIESHGTLYLTPSLFLCALRSGYVPFLVAGSKRGRVGWRVRRNPSTLSLSLSLSAFVEGICRLREARKDVWVARCVWLQIDACVCVCGCMEILGAVEVVRLLFANAVLCQSSDRREQVCIERRSLLRVCASMVGDSALYRWCVISRSSSFCVRKPSRNMIQGEGTALAPMPLLAPHPIRLDKSKVSLYRVASLAAPKIFDGAKGKTKHVRRG